MGRPMMAFYLFKANYSADPLKEVLVVLVRGIGDGLEEDRVAVDPADVLGRAAAFAGDAFGGGAPDG